MSIFFIPVLLIIGVFIGSFLNVLIDRLPNNKSILGRSNCEYCHHVLVWKDLIPLLSFTYLRGKCRYCRKKLSIQYPLLELITGISFVMTYVLINIRFLLNIFDYRLLVQGDLIEVINKLPLTNFMLLNLIFALFFVSILIVIFFADMKYGIIPDQVLIVGILVTIPYLLFAYPLSGGSIQSILINHLLSGAGAFLFFLMIFMLTRGRGMGFGDVKFAFLIGLVLGFPDTALAFYVAFLTGGLIGIILILWKKKRLKSSIAFGPFLVFGTVVSFFLSPLIIQKIQVLL